MIIFWCIPNLRGFCEFLFLLKDGLAHKKRQFHKPPPTFHGFQPWWKTALKTPTVFGGWTHPPYPTIPPSCSLTPLTCQQVTDKSGDPCDLVGTGHISSNCGSNRSFRLFSGLAGFPWFRNWVIITQSRVVFFLKYLDFELDLFCFQLDGFESFED